MAERVAWLRCSASPGYFLDQHCSVYDPSSYGWLRFSLWADQLRVVRLLQTRRLAVVLKARQLGLSWLTVGYALWQMLFYPAATVLIFSKREVESVYLLNFRLRGMYRQLPAWLRAGSVVKDSAHEFRLSNGSTALAFPTTAGRGYTASLAIVDEADHADDLDDLLNAVKPTIDAGGQLVLLSTADKSRPDSPFKRIYRTARDGGSDWTAVFLPWSARPDRSAAWYEAQRRDVQARTGALDDLYQEYPATDLEALAGRSLDKRFAMAWLAQCDGTKMGENGLAEGRWPGIPGLAVYAVPGGRAGVLGAYVIGVDPAEGNPQSDESAASVIDAVSGEQVACLAGRFEPAIFAGHIAALSEYYGGAPALIERNNHGHAVLLWLREFSQVQCLPGLDGKAGWMTTGKSKPMAVDAAADALRDGCTTIHDRETLEQLAALEGATLRAPEGQHDDRAMAHILALAALGHGLAGSGQSAVVSPPDVIAEMDRSGW